MTSTSSATTTAQRVAEGIGPHIAVLHEDPQLRASTTDALVEVALRHEAALAARTVGPLTEANAFLITYGDAVTSPGERPLATLARLLDDVVGDCVSDVHLLPMFPWTSDDGFAVVDHREVDPALGTWADVATVGRGRALMFDFVANHVSASSPWFRGWLARDPRYDGFFITPGADFDTSRVVRPRTTPLTHEFTRPDGSAVRAWTTFGPDQVDVDTSTPAALAELTDVLLGYVAAGADTVRLDAIGYLWKESGTTCLHRPGTHAVVKTWRAMLDVLAPGARLLTETNVPHADNITYFGSGHDEAHLVYQFALPPLVLHSFVSGDATRLSSWAAALDDPGPDATWFNFLASHDGIGMRPASGLLGEEEKEALARRAVAQGGRASYASEEGGGRSVYELNTSFLDALVEPGRRTDVPHVVSRALAAHSILLSMAGVPAIYYHSLFGSSHDEAAAAETGIARRINRQRLDAATLVAELHGDARRRGIFEGLGHMLRVRAGLAAFAPTAAQEVVDLGPSVFAVRRGTGEARVLSVTNVSGRAVALPHLSGADALSGTHHDALALPPDGVAWLTGR